MNTWDPIIAEHAFKLGISEPHEKVILGGPSPSLESLATFGRSISSLLKLIAALPERVFNNNIDLMAEYMGFLPGEIDILKCFFEPISYDVLARADCVRVNGQWRLLELNIGSTVGGMYHASLPRLCGIFQPRDVLSQWATLMVSRFGIEEGSIAFVEDSRFFNYMYPFLSVLANEIAPLIKGKTSIAGHKEFHWDGAKLHGPDGPVDFIYRFFYENDVLEQRNEYAPIINALQENKVCCPMGTFYSLVNNKGVLALLWDLLESNVLDIEEKTLLVETLPHTKRVTYDNYREVLLNKSNYVLKPYRGFGGSGVVCGKEIGFGKWEELISEILSNDKIRVVAQEYAEPETASVYLADKDRNIYLEESRIVWGLYIFGDKFLGAQLRTKPAWDTAIINTANGGAIGPLPLMPLHFS